MPRHVTPHREREESEEREEREERDEWEEWEERQERHEPRNHPTYSYHPGRPHHPKARVYALRRLMADTDFSNVPTHKHPIPRAQHSALFSDEEYQDFLDANFQDVTFTWSEVLLAIAANRAVMSIFVSLGGGGDVDFRAIANDLRVLSQEIRDRYANVPGEAMQANSEIDTGNIVAWRIAQNTILRDFS